MALNFPDSPTLNQVYTDSTSGFSYQWNGSVWISYSPASSGNIRVLDDISSSFNGSTQTFSLTSSSIPISPPNPQSVIVNLGGVVQDPSDDYSISGSNITFTTPPASGLSFSGIILGASVPVGVSTGDVYYRQVYSPTGVQTSFSFVNGYTVGYLDVYQNGAKLIPSVDYTATDGLNFSLIVAAQSGDDIEAIGYKVSAITIVDANLNSLTISGTTNIGGITSLDNNLNVSGIASLGSDLNVTGIASLGSDLSVSGNTNIVGFTTLGNDLRVEGNVVVTGISTLGSVEISSGIITASTGIVTYYGDGQYLDLTQNPNAGVGSETSLITSGIITSVIIDSFIPADEKVISVNTVINNNQENISFAEDLVIEDGTTFTVSTGSTVRMNALDIISPSIASVSEDLTIPNGTRDERPSSPVLGSLRFNTIYQVLEFYNGTDWVAVLFANKTEEYARGVFGAGATPTQTNTLDYISIVSTGNALDFGDLITLSNGLAACSSSTRGVFGGGSGPGTYSNTIEFITITTEGNATDFGDLTIARNNLAAACSSSTRGVFGGGSSPTPYLNTIDYITIASTGDATDFGDLTVARANIAACSSSTRGVFGGGSGPSPTPYLNTIDYITIASTGNALDFGDLTVTRGEHAACSSSTRGVFGGGRGAAPISTTNTIDYITIASVGNATDFGDLTLARYYLAACSSSTRGVFGGGTPATNTLDYITIATIGNATDFGDLTLGRLSLAACSNGHGGVL